MKVLKPFYKIINLGRYKFDTFGLPDLSRSEYWPPEQQITYQNVRLVDIYQHHFVNTPGYRNLCEMHNLTVDSIKGIQDLDKIPIIERQHIQNNLSFRNNKYTYGGLMHTGGSTGESLEYVGCRRYH